MLFCRQVKRGNKLLLDLNSSFFLRIVLALLTGLTWFWTQDLKNEVRITKLQKLNIWHQHWLLVMTINVFIMFPLIGLLVYMTNQIWSNSKLLLIQKNVSQIMNILLFTNSKIIVTSYKCASGQATLPASQHWFNNKLNFQELVWRTLIWKERFPFLHNIRLKIQNKKSMVKL